MKKTKLVNTLNFIYQKLKNENVKWVLIGSASLFLQNVDIEAQDIDIMTDKSGTEQITELFNDFIVKPIQYGTSEYYRSYFGEMKINGVKVEIMGEFEEKREKKWISYMSRLENPVIISIDNINIPVSDLNEQLRGYEKSGRKKDRDRVIKIKERINQIKERSEIE